MAPQLRSILLSLALYLPSLGRADMLVVVNPANPVRTLTNQEVAALYLGRAHSFPSGEFALIFDLPRDHPLRERFYRLIAGMSPGQVNTYWSRLMFAGQEMPPQALPNEQAVLDIVRRNPGAIGYVSALPKDSNLRVVLQVKE